MADMVGLDELFDYKQRLMEDLLTNDVIVGLIDTDGDHLLKPEALVYDQVFPYEYVPTVTEHGKVFVCCEVDIKSVENKTFLVPALYVWVFAHDSLMRLPEGGVRTDRLCSEVVKALNGSRYYGLGELELYTVKRFSPISHYQGHVLTFYTRDYNRIHPTGKKVPANRKEW